MGITIESINGSMDIGYGGFNNIRTMIAELAAPDIGEHYRKLTDGMFLFGSAKTEFFKEYNKKISELDKKYNGEKSKILDFLYASDCEGEMDADHCCSIYQLIKNVENYNIGYFGRQDCATLNDFKGILLDCVENHTEMTWC